MLYHNLNKFPIPAASVGQVVVIWIQLYPTSGVKLSCINSYSSLPFYFANGEKEEVGRGSENVIHIKIHIHKTLTQSPAITVYLCQITFFGEWIFPT